MDNELDWSYTQHRSNIPAHWLIHVCLRLNMED